MKMNGILHQRASVSRLYLKRNEEGRGLRSINRRDNRDREVWIFRLWEKDKQRSQQSSKISEKGRHQKRNTRTISRNTNPKTGQRSYCMDNTLG